MRKILLMNSNGEYFSCDYPGKININSKRNMKKFFKLDDGQIIILPFREMLIQLYNAYNRTDIVEKLSQHSDDSRIYLVANILSNDNSIPEIDGMSAIWTYNEMLTSIFGCDVYAENLFMFLSENEINGNIENVSNEEFDKFIADVREFCDITFNDQSEYLNKAKINILANNILTLNKNDIIEFQDNFIGKKNNTNFTDIIILDDGYTILRKSGILLLHSPQNTAEIYFTRSYYFDDILNKNHEFVC